jgi:PBP1b-binding outer membrane lipoprotein LpoB
MDLRNVKIIACTLALVVLVGCSSNPTTNTATTSGNTPAVNTTTATTTTPAPTVKPSAATPTETAQQIFDAIKNKDIAAVKAIFTKKTLATMEDAAKKRNQSLDDVLKGFVDDAPMPATFSARNEKIEGDRASVEVADEKGRYSPMNFVKEDGAWKVSLER